MCVICYKPANLRLPPKEQLFKMYQTNDDGCGVMWPSGDGRVVGRKFKKFAPLVATLDKLPRHIPIVVHFRIATHGGRDLSYAQPFPFPPSKKEDLFPGEWVSTVGVAHNGTLTGFGDSMYQTSNGVWERNGKKERWDQKQSKWVEVIEEETKLSDTQDFLWFLASSRSLNRAVSRGDTAVFRLMTKLLWSRFAFMYGDGKVRLLGDWEQEKGLWYSNLYWKNRSVAVATVTRDWNTDSGHLFLGDGDGETKEKEADIQGPPRYEGTVGSGVGKKGVCELPPLLGAGEKIDPRELDEWGGDWDHGRWMLG